MKSAKFHKMLVFMDFMVLGTPKSRGGGQPGPDPARPVPRIPTDRYGILWIPMESHRSIDPYGSLRIPMECYRFPWIVHHNVASPCRVASCAATRIRPSHHAHQTHHAHTPHTTTHAHAHTRRTHTHHTHTTHHAQHTPRAPSTHCMI